MFTIEVKKKDASEEFSFKDLEMSHQECYGGKITIGGGASSYHLSCARCLRNIWIFREGSEDPTHIIATAIDGEERKIKGYSHNREASFEVVVVQKP